MRYMMMFAMMACVSAVSVAAHARTYREDTRPVANPGQGWTVTSGSFANYDGYLSIGAIYNRYDWAQLEPAEGKYDWSRLEYDMSFAAKHGIPMAFRVMCANSGATKPVTPEWVWEAGAKSHVWEAVSYSGAVVTNRSPVFEDRTFQRLHRRFIAALAARYDGDPRLAGIDLGSYGNWGEWHCGKLPPAVPPALEPEFRDEARKVRIGSKEGRDLYLKIHASRKWQKPERLGLEDMKEYVAMYLDNFKKTDIVFMTDGAEVLEYAIGNGPASRVGLRRDGIGLEWHFRNWIGSPRYAHVPQMAEVWKSKPVWFEGTRDCRTLISWGKGLFEHGFDFMLSNHVSLVNSFPFMPEQVKDDSTYAPLIARVNLLAGARLVPVSSKIDLNGTEMEIFLNGENKGVARIYLDYVLTVEAHDDKGRKLASADLAADVRTWLPGPFEVKEVVRWTVPVPDDAHFVLRVRHRKDVLRDFRFATPDLTADGALPLNLE